MTPVEELFRLLWDTPKDKFTWFTIRKQMMEKEKEVIMDAYDAGLFDGSMDDVDNRMHKNYYNETFNNEKF